MKSLGVKGNSTEGISATHEEDLKILPSEAPIERPTKSRNRWFLPLFIAIGLCAVAAFLFSRFNHKPVVSAPLSEHISFVPLQQFSLDEHSFFNEWKEHNFHGATSYRIVSDQSGEKMLHAWSKGTSSALFKQVSINLSDRPFLSWEWKVTQFPVHRKNALLAQANENDFAGRVYVAFKGHTPLTSDVIQYVWDDHLPQGAFANSPFSKKVKMFVIRSGSSASQGEWVSEKRDLVKDYEKLFGKSVRGNVTAIGLMSDSDNTGSSSEAYFRRIAVEKPQA